MSTLDDSPRTLGMASEVESEGKNWWPPDEPDEKVEEREELR